MTDNEPETGSTTVGSTKVVEKKDDSFSVFNTFGNFIDKAKKIVTDEKESDGSNISGALGMMRMGAIASDFEDGGLAPPPKPQAKVVDVVVVGAGLAGLSAAYNIHKGDKGVDIVVLEAKDRIGGRLLTLEMKAKDGIEFYDFGWQWVSRSHKNIMQLVDSFDLQIYEQYRKGKTFYQRGDEKMILLQENTKPFGPLDNYDFNSLVNKLEVLRKTLPLSDPTCCKNAKEYDAITLQHFANENTWFEGPRHYFETLVTVTMGVSPREMSLLFFLFALSSGGGWEKIFGTDEMCATQFRIKGGCQRICDILADRIDRNRVIINDPVVSIDQTDDRLVTIKTTDGKEYKADRVIVTVPPKYASRIEFNPPMSPERQSILERMPAGACIVFVITYDEPFWRQHGISGEIFRVVDEDLSKTDRNCTPFSAVLDATSMSDNPALMGYVHAPFWLKEPPLDRRDAILVALKGFFGGEAMVPLQYTETDWSTESFIGCYPSCALTPGAITNYFHSQVKTFDRVHWAGAETAAVFYGNMDGAAASGKRAAKEVMERIRPDVDMDHMDED